MRVSIVVPCFNESASLPLLAERLSLARARLVGYDVEFVLVDDGSSDDTLKGLHELAARLPGARVIAHSRNQGLGVALRTGMHEANGHIVVTMDSDCTYDPTEIPELISRLADADVVLGSPYHPRGGTENVPPHRLALSKTLSGMYRVVLGRRDLHTFTSLFRAYTREAADACVSRSGDYIALAEMLVSLIDEGFRIVEHPTVLRVRTTGVSKMRVLRMIRRHFIYVLVLATRGPVGDGVAQSKEVAS